MFFISEVTGCPATFQRDRIPRLTQLSILVNAFTSWSCTGFLLASLQPLPCWVSLSCRCCSLSRCWFYKTLLKQRDCTLHFWHKMDISWIAGKQRIQTLPQVWYNIFGITSTYSKPETARWKNFASLKWIISSGSPWLKTNYWSL